MSNETSNREEQKDHDESACHCACSAGDETKRGTRSGPEEKRLQGHWLLAKMGKRVLRPGGIEMTRHILKIAVPAASDTIVEFGPGVGRTAQILLAEHPHAYTAVDHPSSKGTPQLEKVLAKHKNARLIHADAAETGLPDNYATLVVGEAMLTMQSLEAKRAVIAEAARILKPGGRYAIHELGFYPDDISPDIIAEVGKGLSRTIKVGARPMTTPEWSKLLEEAGLEVVDTFNNPMHLLEPKRLIADEGLFGALRFAKNVATNKAARARIMAMKKIFRTYQDHINAVGIVARKPE